ncbi:hypothetical protein BD289DRAFT_158717 [Coniella lustricola]|uniref:Secreted protein n=1 Tax=Coniella lustricola TaxID=2025994 RepID=A0A2T3AEI6_9PEZI|nr:hypothetical protein BD289DRAFT_158717 [Coniella lustricola]
MRLWLLGPLLRVVAGLVLMDGSLRAPRSRRLIGLETPKPLFYVTVIDTVAIQQKQKKINSCTRRSYESDEVIG